MLFNHWIRFKIIVFLRANSAVSSRSSVVIFLSSHGFNWMDNTSSWSWWDILECNPTISILPYGIKFFKFFQKITGKTLLWKILLNALKVLGGNPSILAFLWFVTIRTDRLTIKSLVYFRQKMHFSQVGYRYEYFHFPEEIYFFERSIFDILVLSSNSFTSSL